MAYLKLIRPLNLLMIVLTLLLFRFAFVDNSSYILFHFTPKLDNTAFFFLLLSILFTAAGGYVINDIFDAEIDAVNRPDRLLIDREVDSLAAYNYYKVLVAAGVVSTLILAFLTKNLRLAMVPVLITVALNFYAQYFKKQLLAGNFVVAVCSAFVILLPGLYESEKADDLMSPDQNHIESGIFVAALFYAAFAFLSTMLRELLKDVEDRDGDEQYGCRTVPIAWGLKGAKLFATALVLLIAAIWVSVALFFPALKIPYANWVIWGVYVAPLGLLLALIWRSATAVQFRRLSTWTKVYMLAGILSMAYFFNGTGPYLFLQYLNFLKKLG